MNQIKRIENLIKRSINRFFKEGIETEWDGIITMRYIKQIIPINNIGELKDEHYQYYEDTIINEMQNHNYEMVLEDYGNVEDAIFYKKETN